MENFRWCHDRRCPHGEVHDNGNSEPILTCRVCKKRTCFIHHEAWHTGSTCEEHQRRIDPKYRGNTIGEEEKDRYPHIYGKRCPHCTRRVYRIDGCRHMTCRCRGEFCYE